MTAHVNELWPDWSDAGKRVEVKLESGIVVQGELVVDDFFPDGNGGEVPIFVVLADDGTKHGFAANDGWKFEWSNHVMSNNESNIHQVAAQSHPQGQRLPSFCDLPEADERRRGRTRWEAYIAGLHPRERAAMYASKGDERLGPPCVSCGSHSLESEESPRRGAIVWECVNDACSQRMTEARLSSCETRQQEHRRQVRVNRYLAALRSVLNLLSDEQRADLFAEYCVHCGSKDPRCTCANDE